MQSLRMVDQWQVDHAAVAVVSATGELLATHGDLDRSFPLASVTKLLTAYASLIAVEEGAVGLDDEAAGATIRHLLAHTSGLAFESHDVIAAPGTRRIYSSPGFEVLASTLAQRSEIPFEDYLHAAVLEPLGMRNTTLPGSPASGAVATLDDLVRFARELQQPQLTDPSTMALATQVAFPGLSGVLPGFGNQQPNDWGLGFEIRNGKKPHWTGTGNSPRTFGHFGQSGTFLWVDPAARLSCICLTDRAFGPWAAEAWPALSDAILTEVQRCR